MQWYIQRKKEWKVSNNQDIKRNNIKSTKIIRLGGKKKKVPLRFSNVYESCFHGFHYTQTEVSRLKNIITATTT